jgi:hypothetical protein
MSRLRDASLNISKINCQCQTWKSRRNHRSGGLVAFFGEYKSGSAGTDDACMIRWKLQQFYEVYNVDGVVIDCRQLQYDWGDDINFPSPEPLESFPMLLVIDKDQSEAYEYAMDRELQRFHLEGALAEMSETIRIMKSLL